MAQQVHIGMALAWGRQQRGMTISEVAEQLDCNRSWIYRVEDGDNCPSWDFVQQAAKLFGQHVESLRLGVLPDRLKGMTLKKFDKLRLECESMPGGEEQLALACGGVRLPDTEFLTVILKNLKLDVNQLEWVLYLDLKKPVEQVA